MSRQVSKITIKKLMNKERPSDRVFTVSFIRDLEKLVNIGEISYSRMVELMNIRAIQWAYEEHQKYLHSREMIKLKNQLNKL